MRVLFATGSPADYMAPPLLGDEQINCGPDWADQRGPDGRWISLKTPVGEYNLATVAAKLGAAQKPDLVVALVDATWRNQPHGLASFKCPRILLVADTHHFLHPIRGMLRYMTSEPFTRTILLYDRHHEAFFHSAGVRNLFWFPGLTFPHSDQVVRSARRLDKRASKLVFVGQAGPFHSRRARLLAELKDKGVSIENHAVGQSDGLNLYGKTLMGFNASLNGDLNLRVFEILAAGATLLTDRLAPAAGLDSLISEGREFIGYRSMEELVENASYALTHLDETAAIGAAGARWFDTHLNEQRRRQAFSALCFDGTALPEFAFSPAESGKTLFGGGVDRLVSSVIGYESFQENHRQKENVRIVVAPTVPEEISRICATLPRLECVGDGPQVTADVAVMNADDTALPLADTKKIWCWNLSSKHSPACEAGLAAAGFIRSDPAGPWFTRKLRPLRSDDRRHVLLYTDDPESGGVAQYNHTILLALVGAGYRVSCVQSHADNPLIAEQQRAGVTHRWIEYHTGREFVRTLTETAPADEVFCEDPPDLVLFSDCCPLSNLAAREVARQHGIPYIVVVGFVGAYLAKNFAQFLPMLARQYEDARAVIAVSEDNCELLKRLFGAPADRCKVIHYGRPAKFFQPCDPSVRARLRAELNIPVDGVVCFTTARLTAVKGFQHQLRAFSLLHDKPAASRLYFVWAGEGEERPMLEKEIAQRGWKKRIHLLGHRWDVADWYDAADIFVLPSHCEGMPLSIMEAMAKGLPVVASTVSGIPEELGDTGCLLPDPGRDSQGAVDALAEILRRWAYDPVARLEKGQLGRDRARILFGEERMVRRTLTLIGVLAMEEPSSLPGLLSVPA